MLYQCGKDLISADANVKFVSELGSFKSLLSVIVKEELDIFIQHPKIQRYEIS